MTVAGQLVFNIKQTRIEQNDYLKHI